MNIQKKSISALMVTTALLLGGCSILKPYVPPVQQGKVITAKDIQKLKPDMTKEQVRFILGSPDIQDPFQPNHWYYVYTFQRYDSSMEEKKVFVEFKDDKLVKISGDYPPPMVIEYSKTKQNAQTSNTTKNTKNTQNATNTESAATETNNITQGQ